MPIGIVSTNAPIRGIFCLYLRHEQQRTKIFLQRTGLNERDRFKDPVVLAALDAMAKRQFQALEVPTGGTWYISDRH